MTLRVPTSTTHRIVPKGAGPLTVLVAEARSKAEQIRGEGDAERNRIFAEAFGRDPDFFAFYRSMQAYEASLKSDDTRLLLSPDSQFFQYFNNDRGKASQGTGPVPSPEPSKPAAALSAGVLVSYHISVCWW